jgi:SAM-dependent methyltransferase
MGFQAIVGELERAFPIEGYVVSNISPYRTVFDVFQRLGDGLRVLDFGSGPCDKTAVASLLGHSCVAVDDFGDEWYAAQLESIRTFAVAHSIEIRTELPDKSADCTFDVIMLNDVLEHLHTSPREIMVRLVELLRPGGTVFLTVPNLANLRKRLDILRGRTNLAAFELYYSYPGDWRGPVREYVRGDLESLAKFLGLVGDVDTVSHMEHRLGPSLRGPYRLLTSLRPDLRDTWRYVGTKPEGWSKATLAEPQFVEAYELKSKGGLHE